MSGSSWRRKMVTSLFNEQAGTCPYCMDQMTLERGQHNTASIEHIVPASKGGPNVRANFMAVCMDCNQERGNKPLGPHLIAVRSRWNPKAEAAKEHGLRIHTPSVWSELSAPSP